MWKNLSGIKLKTIFTLSWVQLNKLTIVEGSFKAPDVDKVPGKKHYKFNIYLPPVKGGRLMVGKFSVNILDGIITFFRADEQTHSITTVQNGTGIMWSFSFLFSNKDKQYPPEQFHRTWGLAGSVATQ